MTSPIEESAVRLEELKADLTFVGLSVQLRPRMGRVVQWEAHSEDLALVRRFMGSSSDRPEGNYGSLLVRLLAAFERYLRQLVTQIIGRHSSAATSYDDLAPVLASRNVIFTGRLLASLDTPRDHLKIDAELLVQNLASCKPGSKEFRLNAEAFCAGISGVSPMNIEKALENVGINGWWDVIGASGPLGKILGTKGARATGAQARERLQELSRWRNQLAHGGDVEIAIGEGQLGEAIEFIGAFCVALDAACNRA